MDIDGDLVSGLMQQFSCLGTTDRDVLVSQFQKLLGDQLNPAGCAFFLDMNNWNLQAAVCSYFEYVDTPKPNLPRMAFVRDVTIGDGEAVPPSMKFVKTWKIQNPSGDERWPPGCCLRFTAGDQMGDTERVLVEALEPREMADVSVEMTSPTAAGIYQGQWRMSTATGQFFGEVIWVIVTVAEGGLLSLTQQMDAFHQLGSPPRPTLAPPCNPFAASNRFPESPSGMEDSTSEGDLNNSTLDPECPLAIRKRIILSAVPQNDHQSSEHQFLAAPNVMQNCDSTSEEMIS